MIIVFYDRELTRGHICCLLPPMSESELVLVQQEQELRAAEEQARAVETLKVVATSRERIAMLRAAAEELQTFIESSEVC